MTSNPPDTPTTDLDLLTYQQTARRLQVSDRTVWTLCRRGDLRCVRIGSSVRIDPADLAAFIENQKTRA